MSDRGIRVDTTGTSNLGGDVTGSVLGGDKFGLDMAIGGMISSNNSTTTPLAASATYTGTGEQSNFDQVMVVCKTDQPGTLYFDFSPDGTNWDSTFPVQGFRVAASTNEFHAATKGPRYFRVRFVNDDDGDQTYIRLYTYYGNNFSPGIHPLNQSIGIDTDAIVTRPTNFGDEVLSERRPGVSHFTKFGYRTTLTAANGEETIWAATGNFTPLTTASTFTISYTSGTDGSSANGAKALYFQYVDASGLKAVATHTLGSSGTDVTSFTGLGINRVAVASSGSTTYNGSDITITATTGGTIQAFVPAAQSVTQQCIYHTDSNSYGVAKFLFFNVNKLSGSNPKVVVKGYVFNRSVATRYEVFRHTIDTQAENTVQISEPIGFRLSPSDVLYFVADTDQNNTIIALRFSLFEYKIT